MLEWKYLFNEAGRFPCFLRKYGSSVSGEIEPQMNADKR
jgi:hypothetical protein